jgi:hypothetical protein
MVPITCPTCGETFQVPAPHASEVPCDVDYDCEVCCRPMVVSFWIEDGEVVGEAQGIGE